MSNQTLEAFVNSIQNLYQQHPSQSASQSQSPQNQNQSSTSSITQDLNYNEIFNTINSNLNIFLENASNLMDNLLPIFTLPEYTLPNMAVLFSIISQQSAAQAFAAKQDLGVDTSSNGSNAALAAVTVNQDRLLNEVENCIQFSDEKQVLLFFDEIIFN
jgi:hypothetical protein